jgi:hypothetical protein
MPRANAGAKRDSALSRIAFGAPHEREKTAMTWMARTVLATDAACTAVALLPPYSRRRF